MSLSRLRRRVPSARSLGTARLSAHQLAFRKRGRDDSAKCDIVLTARPGDVVHGVLYELDSAQRGVLDDAEGLGRGYEIKTVEVENDSGQRVSAFTYFAVSIDTTLKPYDWYLHHVLQGARENALPDAYIAWLDDTDTTTDPDPARAAAEYAVHGISTSSARR